MAQELTPSRQDQQARTDGREQHTPHHPDLLINHEAGNKANHASALTYPDQADQDREYADDSRYDLQSTTLLFAHPLH